ncbi:MAG TPA: hypothetical protein VK154_13770 [Chitinophagales bacterium]|nr:hypothetical protein [Chitinophagales bacterium]
MDDNNSILIDKYLSNQLTAEELLQFEKRMQDDAAFKAEVELHKDVVGGISNYGRNLMRAEIAATGIAAKSNLDNYKPSKGGGSWGWTLLKGVIFLAALGGVGFPLLVHNDKIEVDPHIKSEIEQMIKSEGGFSNPSTAPSQQQPTIRMETIYHTIKTKSVKAGDTVIITSEEEYKEYLERQEKETKAAPAQ